MSNKIPKEIFINNQDADSINHYGMVQDAVIWSDKLDGLYTKYLSEEHFNSLVEEKDKEIERLRNIVNGACFICNKLKDKCTCTASTNYLI